MINIKEFYSGAHELPAYISYDDKELIHRLLTGLPLTKINKHQKLIESIAIEKLCYIYFKWTHLKYADFKDILGALHNKNYDMAVFLIGKANISQMKAFLHLLGCTNDKLKWVISYSNFIPDYFHRLKSIFRYLIHFDHSNEIYRNEYILKSFDFIDLIFKGTNFLLDQNFPDISRHSLYSELYDAYTTQSNHSQIDKQFAFNERFFSKNFIPSRAYLDNSKKILPLNNFN